jgi:hypothetical protein
MRSRSVASNLGIYAYAAGAIFLGIVGLASGDFATPWQHVEMGAPFRTPLAYLVALIELTAGLALLWRQTARIGALTLRSMPTERICMSMILLKPLLTSSAQAEGYSGGPSH